MGYAASIGHILVAGPCFYPLGNSGYGGMERLASLVSMELGRLGYEVDVVGGARSREIPGCRVWRGEMEGSFVEAEQQAWQEYGWLLATGIDFVIDFSHSHLFRLGKQPGVSWIWHDPHLMQPKVPFTGLYALSQWQAQRHQERTGQHIEVLDCICADPEVYFYDSKVGPGDRWFSLGILDANKGQREAALLAEEAGIGLDIAGKPVDEKVVRDIREVEKRTQGRVRYLGELTLGEMGKADLMRKARGMFYWPSYPEGYGEAHSQKLVEALMCGMPCVVRDQGAMSELFNKQAVVTVQPDFDIWSIRQDIAQIAKERWSTAVVTQRILDGVKVKA